MNNPDILATAKDLDYFDYRDSEKRKSLYRVLARNIVRELRTAGHGGSELLGFVGEVMEAISEAGFQEVSRDHTPMQHDLALGASDDWGRPTFTGERLLLRPPTPADRPAIESWLTDPWVQRSLAPRRIAAVLASLEKTPDSGRLDLALCDPESGYAFGMVSLEDIDRPPGQAELGKVIGAPEYRGRGLAGTATLCLLDYGFESLGLHRISLRTLGGNLKNIRLNEGIGFRFEGVLHGAHEIDGTWRDVVIMALLRDEFLTLEPRPPEA